MTQKQKMMLAARKGQSTVLRTLVLAVLLLVVLSILIVFFTGKFRLFSKGLVSCEGKGGICSDTPCAKQGMASIQNHDCKVKYNKSYCCIPVE